MSEHEQLAAQLPSRPVTLEDVLRELRKQSVQLQDLTDEQLLQGQRLDGVFRRLTEDRRRDILMAKKIGDIQTEFAGEFDELIVKVTDITNAGQAAAAALDGLAAKQAATNALLEEALKNANLTPEQEAAFTAFKASMDAQQAALVTGKQTLVDAIVRNTETPAPAPPAA